MALTDYRMSAVAVLTWLTILLSMWSLRQAVVVAGVTVCLMLVAWRRWGARPLLMAICAVWAVSLLGIVATAAHQHLRNPDVLTDAPSGIDHEFVVRTAQTVLPGTSAIDVTIVTVDHQSTGRIPATIMMEPSNTRLAPGTVLTVVGQVLPGQALDRQAWRIFASQWSVREHAPAVFNAADGLREALLTRSVALGGDGGALLPGLSLGDTSAVSESLETDMRAASLAHLVAVSGANCAIVVGIAVVITGLCGGGIRARLVVGVTTLVGFVILVTPEPSVIRASVMATIALASLVWGRPTQGLSVLAATAWLLLMVDPWRAVDFAFVLSVAATAGIVVGLKPTATALSRFMPGWLAWLIGLPLVAQLAVQPIVVLLRPALPVWGIPANLLAAPFVPAVTITGLVGSIAEPFAPWLSQVAVAWGWWPSSAIAAIARAVATLPVTEIPWWSGFPGAMAAALLSGCLWWAVWSRRWRRSLVAMGVIGVMVVGSQLLPPVLTRLAVPAGWKIAQCDVGQGDAVVVATDQGYVVIDTGDDEELLRECLAILGISQINTLVLTHFDRDHVGQSAVFHKRVDTVLAGPPDNAEDLARLDALANHGGSVVQVQEGFTRHYGDYSLEVVWPTSTPLGSPGNDSSVVVALRPTTEAGLSLLALGDLGEVTQSMLHARLPGQRFDVVKVSHHGSADQSEAFYRDIDAVVGLIGVGGDNDYGHPSGVTLSLLDSLDTQVIRSDQLGTATLGRSENGLIELWSQHRR